MQLPASAKEGFVDRGTGCVGVAGRESRGTPEKLSQQVRTPYRESSVLRGSVVGVGDGNSGEGVKPPRFLSCWDGLGMGGTRQAEERDNSEKQQRCSRAPRERSDCAGETADKGIPLQYHLPS